jgi:hypothetical protein
MSGETIRTHQRHALGFTLMEVMAAIFLTSIVITFAVSFYIDIANSSQRAIVETRKNLRATGVLARVSRDLSNVAFVVKKEEDDPLTYPWFFMADSRLAFDGSDMIKFNTRSSMPGEGTYHDSDLEQVSYQVLAEEDGSLTLFRWSSPGQELGSDMTFPLIDDDRNYIVAEGLGSFTLRFLDSQGQWLPGWDSTQIEESEELPHAIEIDISMWTDEDLDEWESENERHYVKQVVLHQRPLDISKMIEARDLALAEQAGGPGLAQGQFNEDGQRNPSADGSANPSANDDFFGGDAATPGSVAECTRQNWGTCVDRYGEGNCGVWANVTQVPVQAFGIDLPWCNY